MILLTRKKTAFATILAHLLAFIPGIAAEAQPNVLFIAVDDLRPELGCYGAAHIHSPNIDAFAASGRRFERAYCQQAVCNPSRTSLMTGMRPDTIGVTGNHSHFRSNRPDVVTLPQHFKKHGYHAAAIGKIFHGVFPEGASITKWDTMGDPESWSVPAIRFGPRYYYTEQGVAAAKTVYQRLYRPKNPRPDDWAKKLVFGPATEAPDVTDNTLYDGKVADAAVRSLRELGRSEKPFFLAVGFIKPHSPYIAPKKYFDLYEDVSLPTRTELPAGAPGFVGHRSGELRRYTDQPNSGEIPVENQLRVRRAYFACISYVDAQIGRVLDELDQSGLSENTIVVLYGDHGYHLGEHGLWGKTTNYELDTRVPLIVRTPNQNHPGRSTESLVELIDLYPTLAELAGLPLTEQLEGKSLVPVLDDPTSATKPVALSQYPRAGGLMGYSMRTSTHRLTQWIHGQSGEVRATELYDYSGGLIEAENSADASPDVVEKLAGQLNSLVGLSDPEASDQAIDSDLGGDVVPTISFEQAKAGVFGRLETGIGTWTSIAGRAIIDDKHAKSGDQCLQLTGGDETAVTLELSEDADTTGELTFWAERWTKRGPFSFRIEKNSGDGWQEIFNGDMDVRVGRAFLSHVRVPLGDKRIRQLRFAVTSPENTGVLIDDVRLASARPQKIVGVEVVPLTVPALVGVPSSPLITLKIEAAGSLNPISITELKGRIENAALMESLDLSNDDGADDRAEVVPLAMPATDESSKTWNPPPIKLVDGANYITLGCELKDDADIDQRVGAKIDRIGFSNGRNVELRSVPSLQRIGVAVRNGGDDGVHTYRIPGLATTKNGTLIAVYDVRRRSGRDLPGDIDVGMSRSTDGGRTWEPMRVIMDMGEDPEWSYDGIGDPAVLVDQNAGTIWVAATWSHGDRSWRGSGPGLSAEETGQLMLVRSDDDGATWSKPINITEQIKQPDWCFVLQGPGKGITMADGTIVFAAQYQDPPENNRLPHSTIIYSKDHGKTWAAGTGAFDDTTEAQVIEVEPGVLMLNCRYNRKGTRVVMTTRDMGRTWQKHSTSERSLIEPGACMASLIDVDREVGKGSDGWLLFSNPDSTRGRHHITIKASPDRGLTWPKVNRLLLDEGKGSGYSCMSMIDEETVGILYEGSQAHMTFQRIPLGDLLSEAGDLNSAGKDSDANQPGDDDAVAFSLPRVFGDNMVLQADSEIPIWGKAAARSQVSVTLGGECLTTQADSRGDWAVRFPPRTATETATSLSVQSGRNRMTLGNVLIGEVWVCAGQSNMEWPLNQSSHGREELSAADHPYLRLLHLAGAATGSSGSYTSQHLKRLQPELFCEGTWEVASTDSARNFSAAAWYFGRRLQRELGVPIGLICPAVGGTPTEAWIPREALNADPDLRGLVAGNWLDNERLGEFCRTRGTQNLLAAIQSGEAIPSDQLGPNHSFKPGFMWDAGIQPLIPYAIRGVIWYQGESNAETVARVRQHDRLFPMLVSEWRKNWRHKNPGQGDFPFLFAQLPALNRSEWPLFRDRQRRMLGQLKNVGMAITIDTGHASNVHPALKKPVGERLARWALGTTYGQATVPFSGPLQGAVERLGESLVISFEHAGGGLKTSDGQPVRHFEICGKDGEFYPADANVIGRNRVAVSSIDVTDPIHVRYAWMPYPDPPVNLCNSADLPASPFTTETIEASVARQNTSPMQGRPNILFIVSEDNSDHLGCYGESRVHTPHLDALAAGGVRYTRAYVPYSVCSPSRAAFLTGLYTRQTGHVGLATHRFSMYRDFKTMPAYFRQAGYYTGFLGKTHVNPERVVENFVDHRAISNSNFGKTISIETYADQARSVMKNAADQNRPFMLIINYADAHRKFVAKSNHGFPTTMVTDEIEPFPWIGSDSPNLRKELKGYFNCINRLDEGIGMVMKSLDEVGVRDNTLVVYISDHGADFPRGKGSIYENGTRVPMIVNYPKAFSKGKVENGMVSTIDLLPTMLRVARLPVPKHLPGIALQEIDSGRATPHQYIHTFTGGSSPNLLYLQFGIRDDRYKLVYNPDRAINLLAVSRYRNSNLPRDQHVSSFLHPPEYELFDLQADPHEWKNLAENKAHQPIRDRLLKAMKEFQREINDPFVNDGNVKAFIAEQKEYRDKPYKNGGFRWPHLEMFRRSQEVASSAVNP